MRYIYCHPLFDERKCAHRFSYQLSKAFEKNNLQLERFDYQGTGEAKGAFSDVTMVSLKDDLKTIINSDKACLIGTRLGATIAFDYCCQNKSPIQSLILIEPIVVGQNYARYLFRKQHLKDIMTGKNSQLTDDNGFCNLEGYKTNNKFIDQIKEIQLTESAEKIKSDMTVHIVQISTSPRINPEYTQLTERLKKAAIPAFVEAFNLPAFWERIPDEDYSTLTGKIIQLCR